MTQFQQPVLSRQRRPSRRLSRSEEKKLAAQIENLFSQFQRVEYARRIARERQTRRAKKAEAA